MRVDAKIAVPLFALVYLSLALVVTGHAPWWAKALVALPLVPP
jgi:hypothetical protein